LDDKSPTDRRKKCQILSHLLAGYNAFTVGLKEQIRRIIPGCIIQN